MAAQTLITSVADAIELLTNLIFELKDSCGRLLHNSPRKTAIWGFTVSLHSMAEISQHLLKHHVSPFGYIVILGK